MIADAPTSWLLLRGLGREQRHWGSFPEALSKKLGARVVMLDLPGFGTENARRSPLSVRGIAQDVRARLARERRDERFAILGISLGGMVALEWCARHPEDFERCVVINSSARSSPMFERFKPKWLRAPLSAGRFEKERGVLALTSDRNSAELDDLAQKQADFATPKRGSMPRQLIAAGLFNAPKRMRTPVLVMASRTDRLVAYRCSERIAESVGGDLTLSEKGGHDLTLDEPDWVCDRIATWTSSSLQSSANGGRLSHAMGR